MRYLGQIMDGDFVCGVKTEKNNDSELALKYLKADMTREEAIKIFPSFERNYL